MAKLMHFSVTFPSSLHWFVHTFIFMHEIFKLSCTTWPYFSIADNIVPPYISEMYRFHLHFCITFLAHVACKWFLQMWYRKVFQAWQMLDIPDSLLLVMFYFAETHTQRSLGKVKVALVVLVDVNNHGRCQWEFCFTNSLPGILPHSLLAMMMVLLLPLQHLLLGPSQHQYVLV